MAKFILEAEFLVPHLVRYCIEAESEAEALVEIKRMEANDPNADFWDNQFEDFDSSRPTTYSNVTDEYGDRLDRYQPGERADGGGS